MAVGADPDFGKREWGSAESAQSRPERLPGDALAGELAFWKRRLADLPVLDLPADRPRPAGGSNPIETIIRDFPENLRDIVQQLADDYRASLFVVFAAAFNLVLSRYTGLDDIPIGVPMLGRPEPAAGTFINMVVLRSDLSGDPVFAEIINRVADKSMELYEHREVSFQEVVDVVQPVRESDHHPLFQVSLLALGDGDSGEHPSFEEATAEFLPPSPAGPQIDIAMTIDDSGSSLRAGIVYSVIFDRWRVEAMLTDLQTVLRAVATDPGLRLSQIPIVSRRASAANRAEAEGGAEAGADRRDAPRTQTEQSVADIFAKVLSLPKLGAEESFFSAGGNSLKAMLAISRINKGFGIKLGVRTLYGNVTARAVSAVVDSRLGGDTA